jgi:hypothetical protein
MRSMIQSHLFQAQKQQIKCCSRIQVSNHIGHIHLVRSNCSQLEEILLASKEINCHPKDWEKIVIHSLKKIIDGL